MFSFTLCVLLSVHFLSVSGNWTHGIYWSEKAEKMLPKGFGEQDDLAWIRFVSASSVIKIKDGCGAMQNRLVIFEGPQKSCARSRQNLDQIQGEIFSFYLGRVLGLSNLVPSSLSFGRNGVWNKVQADLKSAKWNLDKPVVLTKFVEDLSPVYIPRFFRGQKKRLHPIDLTGLNQESELTNLIQWSDLIVFDYLTANLDRIVNNLFNEQWNSEMMSRPAHNLVQSQKSGLLLFIDNESGLLHGYRLLKEYEPFHRTLLDSLCVFRKRTADIIESFHKDRNVSKAMRSLFYKTELNSNRIPFLPERNCKILQERIATVHRQIAFCKSLYSSTKAS